MRKLLNLVMSMMIVGACSVSCSDKDNTATNDSGTLIGTDTVPVKIVEEKSMTSGEVADLVFGPDGGNGSDTISTLRKRYVIKAKQNADEAANLVGANSDVTVGMKYVTYLYESTDEKGAPIWLSAVATWGTCSTTEDDKPKLDNIFLYEHYTIANNLECPSSVVSMDENHGGLSFVSYYFAHFPFLNTSANLIICPDYIGYGHSKGHEFLYLNHEIMAKNSVDALKAGYQVARSLGVVMNDDWKTYALGASQGGSAALAVHKYMDTHPAAAQEWNFNASDCCSGPYCPSITYQTYLKWNAVSYPVVLPLVIKSMIASYPDMMGKWKEEDFYSDEYQAKKAKYDSVLCNMNHTIDEVNQMFFEDFADRNSAGNVTGSVDINKLLSKDALDSTSEMSIALVTCLKKNDLSTGWSPSHSIKLFHGTNDDVVPIENSEAIAAVFPDVASFTKNWFFSSHSGTCATWMANLMTAYW